MATYLADPDSMSHPTAPEIPESESEVGQSEHEDLQPEPEIPQSEHEDLQPEPEIPQSEHEDLQPEPEIPQSEHEDLQPEPKSRQSESLVLHVLTGPQSGAEMALRNAVYTVGAAEDCDIVLYGAGIADNHLALTIDSSGVSVEAQRARIWTAEGILEPGDRSEIDDAAVLTLGAASIAVGPQGTDWESLSVPEVYEPEVDPSQEMDAEAESDQGAEAPAAEGIGVDGDEDQGGGDAESEPAEQPDPATDTPTDALSSQSQRFRLIAASVVLLVVIIGTAALLMFQGGDSNSADANRMRPTDQIAAAAAARVKALSLKEVNVETEGPNQIALTGYVADAGQLGALKTSMTEGGIEFVDRVRVVSELMDNVRLTLSGFGWPVSGYGQHLKVGYAGGGILFLDGYIGSEVDRTRLHRAITTDVPAVRDVEFRRASLDFWAGTLRDGIAEAGLHRWIRVTPSNNRLRVSGELTEAEAETWRVAAEAFSAKSGGYPQLDIDVRLSGPARFAAPAPAAEPAIPSEIRPDLPPVSVNGVIIYMDGMKLALFSDGDILQVGDTIDGFEVIDIQEGKVVLRNGDTQYTYNLGRKRYE